MLDHDLPVPLWQQLASLIKEKISKDEITGRVPSAKTLAQEHDVSTRTSEHALAVLRDEGVIVAVHGVGYFVKRA